MIKPVTEKALMYHHRSYRKLPRVHPRRTALEFFVCSIIISLIILKSYPALTYYASYLGSLIFSNARVQYEIIASSFIFGDIYILDIFGRYPSLVFSIYAGLISLFLIILLPLLKFISKPVFIWFTLIFSINLVSSIFFIFFADYFPYTLWNYLELYLKTEICIWLIIPYILIFAFLPLPANFISKLLLVLKTLLYTIIFSFARYIIFIFILREFSYLYLAMLSFIFGPFLNYIFIIRFYSIFVSKLAARLQGDESKWAWLY